MISEKPMTKPIIEIKNLSAGYDGRNVLHDINLAVYERDFLGIIGPNGGGKTTLIKCILGLLKPTGGEISFNCKPSLGYLPQYSTIDRKFPISVEEVILSGLSIQKSLTSRFTPEQKEKGKQIIARMGLEGLEHRAIGQLSGGQLQRALLGRAIISDPSVLILDEPSTYIDKRFEARLYELLAEINKECAIILVSHDIGTVSINPQTLEDEVLRAIGRRHTAEDIREAYALAREVGFDSINMDLIAGLPRDSYEGFCRTLDGVLAMAPENITVHTLALKKGSTLMEKGGAIPSGEETARMLEYSLDALGGAGYRPYYLYRQKYMSGSLENVGWTLPGLDSVYNIAMMEELHTIVSLGGGGVTKLVDRATGYIERLANAKYPQEYIQKIDAICADKGRVAQFYAAHGR